MRGRFRAMTCRSQVGIFEPDQLRHAAGERNQIDLAIVVHIAGHHLVATGKFGIDSVRTKLNRGSSQRRAGYELS